MGFPYYSYVFTDWESPGEVSLSTETDRFIFMGATGSKKRK